MFFKVTKVVGNHPLRYYEDKIFKILWCQRVTTETATGHRVPKAAGPPTSPDRTTITGLAGAMSQQPRGKEQEAQRYRFSR